MDGYARLARGGQKCEQVRGYGGSPVGEDVSGPHLFAGRADIPSALRGFDLRIPSPDPNPAGCRLFAVRVLDGNDRVRSLG